jgi:uroporphyrinogen-III decarboxylase
LYDPVKCFDAVLKTTIDFEPDMAGPTLSFGRAMEKLGGRICIMGNVFMSLMVGGTPEEVEAYCKKIIDVAGKDGGFIMSGAAVLDNARPENVRAMMESTREYGLY